MCPSIEIDARIPDGFDFEKRDVSVFFCCFFFWQESLATISCYGELGFFSFV